MKLCLLLLLSLAAAILIRQPAETLATNDEILAEIKHRVELCAASGSPLAPLSLDALFAELKLREAEKICEPPSHAPPETPRPAAAAPSAVTATTTATTPCPSDNFMDEIVDQAKPNFETWDANKDGCLGEEEMTATLRRQRDVAHERGDYWLRKNVTAASRRLEQRWRAHHDAADANGRGCLNREELEIIQHAVCDCGTQFLFVDSNADGQISGQEAATYVAEHMRHAALNYNKLRAIWKVADLDENGFLSRTEFCEAGPRHKGHGDDEVYFAARSYKGDGDDQGDEDETGDGDNAGTEAPLRAIAEIPETEEPDPLLRDA